jgi:starvation-inducible DNA-binding protein
MLSEALKITFADVYTFALKTQFYHWNVEGPDFKQYHEFLGDLYHDVNESVDTIAELIRTLDVFTPGTLTRIKELTTIPESDVVPDDMAMFINLRNDNELLLTSLRIAYREAETESALGISNYLQDRIQAHEKHGWMLRAITK